MNINTWQVNRLFRRRYGINSHDTPINNCFTITVRSMAFAKEQPLNNGSGISLAFNIRFVSYGGSLNGSPGYYGLLPIAAGYQVSIEMPATSSRSSRQSARSFTINSQPRCTANIVIVTNTIPYCYATVVCRLAGGRHHGMAEQSLAVMPEQSGHRWPRLAVAHEPVNVG